MFSLKYIKKNIDLVKRSLEKRGSNLDISALTEIDEKKNIILSRAENLKNIRNKLSKEIGLKRSKSLNIEDLMLEASKISSEIKELDISLNTLEISLKEYLLNMPNVLDESVPYGTKEEDNVIVKTYGKNISSKDMLTHDELLSNADALDSIRGVKMSGTRFVVLKNLGAQLDRALSNFMLRTHSKKGYEEVAVPVIVKEESMVNSGQLPKFRDDAYETLDGMFLIPTGEVAIVNMFANEIIPFESLDKKIMTHSSCFRKESGSYGKDTKGLIRLHQFSKVELINITTPEKSNDALESMLNEAENILQLLNLPYRVVLKCSYDTGFTASKTYDIEVWMPGQNRYVEISSCSNTLDFQSRRASIKFKKDNKSEYVHMLNGSGLPIGRTMAALVENNQINGSIDVQKLIDFVNNL
jgi:seryl-tRNA synthetase